MTDTDRRLVITQNITLDGRIEMLGDWFDPADDDPEMMSLVRSQMDDEEILLLGRRTFEDFRGYWPLQTDDATGISDQLNAVDKRVVSTTLGDPRWENTTVIDADPVVAVRALTAEPGREIVCTGSITLCHALFRADVVDEVRLFTYPVVQGAGRTLFGDYDGSSTWTPVDHRPFASGIVYGAWARKRP